MNPIDKAASRLAPKVHDGRFDFYVSMNGAVIGATLNDRAAVSTANQSQSLCRGSKSSLVSSRSLSEY
jgi:hypothetical protein